jgi:6-phosphogluconolactonase
MWLHHLHYIAVNSSDPMQKILLAMTSILISCSQLFAGQWLFIGSYTSTGSKGIYVYKFDETTGKLDTVSNIFIENPSYLALSQDGNFLYAVTENGGDKPGEVSAFSFDKESGKLTFLNKQLTKGDHPCYVSVDEANNWVAVANYSGGNLSMFPVNKDGSLEPAAQTIQHYGKSIIESRQAAPHVHMAIFSPKQQYLVANDLGTDEVNGYKFHSSKNGIPLDTPASIRL